jgi:hypothetical protein
MNLILNIETEFSLSIAVFYAKAFYDIQGVRQIEDNTSRCPLTGFPLLGIETAWKCHYIAFRTEEILNEFLNRVNSQIFPHQGNTPKKDEWNARMWQNIQSCTDTSGESAKWASIILPRSANNASS